jgi:hypothetical protein
MKDKELREVLVEAGVIRDRSYEGISFLEAVAIEDKIDAIARYLGIKFERIPETVVARIKDAPQNAVEAKPEQHTTQSVRQPEEPASARA